jgi:hypothetical protein
MKTLYVAVMIFFSGVIMAQECKIDLNTLAHPDNNMTQLNKFWKCRSFKIVLTDGFDTIANKEIVNRLSQWFLNQSSGISTVNINELKELDDSCHYLIIGITDKLKDLSVFDIPVKVTNDKRSLGPIELTDNDDAITIINEKAKCVAVWGNSYPALINMSSGRFLGLYDYYILKKNKMSFMGDLKENRFTPDSLVDLALIRMENYSRKIENEYVVASISCKYKTISQFQLTIDSLIDSFTEFCRLYKVKRPSQKLQFFIHADQSEINIVSGDPKPGSTGGFVADRMIHTVGIDKELLLHEGVHFIFNSNSGCHNAFFNEGIPLSFALFQHPEHVTSDCKLIQDNLEILDLITGKTAFWNGPYKNGQCLSYPISGLFIKFLIDRFGIDKLRKFYNCRDISEGFKTIYNMELPVVVSEWKNFVLGKVRDQ